MRQLLFTLIVRAVPKGVPAARSHKSVTEFLHIPSGLTTCEPLQMIKPIPFRSAPYGKPLRPIGATSPRKPPKPLAANRKKRLSHMRQPFLSIYTVLAEDTAEVETVAFIVLTVFFRLFHRSDEFLAATVDAFTVSVTADGQGHHGIDHIIKSKVFIHLKSLL